MSAATLWGSYRQSAEVWKLCRPPVTLSPLRYSTHFDGSTWAASILGEISQSEFVLQLCEDHAALREALANALVTPSVWGAPTSNESEVDFAFQRATRPMLPKVAGWTLSSQLSERLKEIIAYFGHSADPLDVAASLVRLAKAKPSEQVVIGHEVRRSTFCGYASGDQFLRSFEDQSWRKSVLVDGDSSAIDLFSTAAVELSFTNRSPNGCSFCRIFMRWLARIEASRRNIRELLFAYTVVSSMATESITAVTRLLRGTNRQEFTDQVAKWCKRIES